MEPRFKLKIMLTKRIVMLALGGGLLILAVLIAGFLYLPVYLESRLIPQTAETFGATLDHIEVRRVGLTGADLGPLELSIGNTPSLRLSGIQIDYSPLGLLRRKINGITISGLHFGITVSETGVAIAGLSMPLSRSPHENQTQAPPNPETRLPVELNRVRLQNALVDITWRNRRLQVPVEIDCTTTRLSQGRLNATVTLSPRGNPITIVLELNVHTNHATMDLAADKLVLESFADLTERVAPAVWHGLLTARGHVQCRLAPFAIDALDVTGRLDQTRLTLAEWAVTNLPSSSATDRALNLAVHLEAPDRYTWSCGPLQAAGPLILQADEIDGRISRSDTLWHLSATGRTRLPAQTVPTGSTPALVLEEALSMPVTVRVDQTAATTVAYTLASQPDDRKGSLRLRISDHTVTGRAPHWSAQGTFADKVLASHLKASLADFGVRLPDGTLHCPAVALEADATVRFPDRGPIAETRATISLSGLSADTGGIRARIPKLTAHMVMTREPERPLTVGGRVRMAEAGLKDSQRGVSLDDIDVALPFQWPAVSKPAKGTLKIGSMLFQGRAVGDLTGSLFQKGTGLELAAVHHSKLLNGLRVLIESKADAAGLVVDFKVPLYQPATEIDLGRFSEAAKGFTAAGRLEADGRMAVGVAGRASATARLKLDGGRLTQPDLDIALTGIGAELRFQDLIGLRSGPEQKLSIDTIRFGKVVASDLRADFQIESAGTLFIEKAAMKWCKGMVTTNAIRIKPGVDDYNLTLVCDRLNLAMLLAQLGAAQGSGEGAVNGVIPVRWSNHRLSFDKGFLYSTPGQTGTIRLKGTEFLLAGLPQGSPQHTQLDIATEALKDYTYNWAKLSLESNQDILLIKLQLDGKPNRLLPFAFDKNVGSLIRVEGQGNAEFKGINIDVNFRSPINEILNYRQLLKTR
jgi:Dicarboxylate transport